MIAKINEHLSARGRSGGSGEEKKEVQLRKW